MVLSKWFPSSPFVFHLKVNTTFKCSLTHNLCFQPYYFLVNVVCMGVISPYVSSIILLAHTILHEIIVQFENSIYSVCMCICMRNIMSYRKKKTKNIFIVLNVLPYNTKQMIRGNIVARIHS